MARPPHSKKLVHRAEAAMMAAIEIYNKPDFEYREETFAILALNAWELLLKARVVATSGNDIRSIHAYAPRTGANGKPTTKHYVKRNRTGNPMTIGIGAAVAKLDVNQTTRLPSEVKDNLDALIQIRDNVVHFIALGPTLTKEVLQIGTAAVRNFIELARKWFQVDFSQYKLYLMPIGFLSGTAPATAIMTSQEEKNLIAFLSVLTARQGDGTNGFHVALEVSLSFKKSPLPGAIMVSPSKDPNATPVTMTEENIRQTWPWDYRELCRRLRARYIDFLENTKFHKARKPLEGDERFARIRYLDPANKNSGSKCFYNSNIMAEFDRHYTRK